MPRYVAEKTSSGTLALFQLQKGEHIVSASFTHCFTVPSQYCSAVWNTFIAWTCGKSFSLIAGSNTFFKCAVQILDSHVDPLQRAVRLGLDEQHEVLGINLLPSVGRRSAEACHH